MSLFVLSYGDENTYENKRLIASLTERKIHHQFLSPCDISMVVSRDEPQILVKGHKSELPDIALVRYGAGITDNTVAFIRELELSGVRSINSSSSITKAKDKLLTGQILSSIGIRVPKTMPVQLPANVDLIEEHIGLPCVIKLVTGSYGEGVYLCKTACELRSLLSLLAVVASGSSILAQEYLGSRAGEDVRVLVVGDEIIGAMRRTAPTGDFRANISAGGTGSPHPVTDEIRDIVIQTVKALGLTIAGIDLLFTDEGFAVCEANSNPGFLGFERYCEVDVAARITDYIQSIHS